MWKSCVMKQHLEQPCLVSSEVLYQAERGRKAPYRKMVLAWSRCSWQPAAQLCSTALTSACSPSETAQTVPVAPYLHLLFGGDCSVPADTPGLCPSFRKFVWTTAERAQYGSGWKNVCSSWILKVKFCSKSSIPQKTSPNPTFGERAVSPPSTKRTPKGSIGKKKQTKSKKHHKTKNRTKH